MVQLSDATPPAIGALVRVRGCDWVVIPASETDVLRLRPLTGGDDADAIGVYLPLEGRDIQPSAFDPPDPAHAGDATGGLVLLDAARLSLRSGATPFRCLGRLSVTPRPYQFVPLMLALRQNPVRLLLADDVGTGKTIEQASSPAKFSIADLPADSRWFAQRTFAISGKPSFGRNLASKQPSFSRRGSAGWSVIFLGRTFRSTSITAI